MLGRGWGIGSLTFGLGLHLLGFSLGYTIIFGIIAVTGSLIPMCVYNLHLLYTGTGIIILIAMIIAILGVVFCGQAGQKHTLSRSDATTKKKSTFRLGLMVCIVSGILSAMLNLAFDFGSPIARNHLGETASTFKVNNAIWFLALPGGFVPYFVYCSYLLLYKRPGENIFCRKLQGIGTGHS